MTYNVDGNMSALNAYQREQDALADGDEHLERLQQELADLHLEAALVNARLTGNESLTGKCKWCSEPTRGAFCSAECRNDYTKREHMRNG